MLFKKILIAITNIIFFYYFILSFNNYFKNSKVHTFDYPYMKNGKKMPDNQKVLIAARIFF